MPYSINRPVLAALFFFGAAIGTMPPAAAQETTAITPDTLPSILVSGTGVVKVKPDTVYVSIGVVTREKEAAASAQANAAKTDAVIKALVKSGIAVADIHTDDYTLEAEYADKKGVSVFIGYTVSNTVRVIVRQIANAGRTIDAALHGGANTVDSVTFGLADPQKAQDAARANAIAEATRKAKIAAKAAGLGAIRFLSMAVETSGSSRERDKVYLYSARVNAIGTPPPTRIEGGQQIITATVTVRFGIVEPTPLVAPSGGTP